MEPVTKNHHFCLTKQVVFFKQNTKKINLISTLNFAFQQLFIGDALKNRVEGEVSFVMKRK